tara:strand:+ start:111 stop:461 length:351 start_codon:yes stop_codon:yes gene_type:complete
MSLTTKGTPHLYGIQGGIAIMTNCTVISFSLTKANKNTGETQDEIGNEIERRYDDLHQDGSITIRPRTGFTSLVPGANYTYDGVEFEVVSEGNEEQNQGFVALTYTIKKSEYVAYD